jgi:multidrug efflux pump subunit AcrA (membrane-fusion protein)
MNTLNSTKAAPVVHLRRVPPTRFLALVFAALGLFASTTVLAHGGEDHGSAATPAPSTSGRNSASAQSESFDIVAEYGSIEPAKPTGIDLYLSDYETNAPVAGASIQVSISGVDNSSVAATAEKDSGLYSVSMTFPAEGHFDILFDITSSDKSDIIEVKGISVGTERAEPPKTARSYISAIILVGLAAVLLVLTLFFIRRRKNTVKVAATTGAIFLLISLLGPSIHAHGGEDHGEAGGSAAASGTPGYMSKASQFLLGVRTVLAKNRAVSKQISALGRVVAPPTSQVQVYPPQSGLLVASTDVPYPSQGDWVHKGQAIAVLQVLDQFVIRAPISGIVSSIHAVPGEQVDPAHELFTIYDYTKVWVEANLFENDLIHLEPKPPASLSVDISPGDTFRIRFVNFESVVDPATRTLKAVYEVDNQKMILRPGMIVGVNIESETRLDALVVPDNSVMDWEGQKVVFVHEQPEIFEMRPIKILGYYGDFVAVEGSLAEGERVVITGAYELLNMPHRVAEGRSK